MTSPPPSRLDFVDHSTVVTSTEILYRWIRRSFELSPKAFYVRLTRVMDVNQRKSDERVSENRDMLMFELLLSIFFCALHPFRVLLRILSSS